MGVKLSIRLASAMTAALVAAPGLGTAQPNPAPRPVETPTASDVAHAPDPARLAAAQALVDQIAPQGFYARMMEQSLKGVMSSVMNQMIDNMSQMSLRDVVAMAGMKPEDAAKLGKGTVGEIMAIMDPNFKARTAAYLDEMTPMVMKMASSFEPDFRDGLTQAYARRFTLDQLNDINRFFATPSGGAYAANAMLITTDPLVLGRMTANLPKMLQGFMQQLPEVMKRAQARTASLPPPKRHEDLTPAERARLAELLGVPPAALKPKPGADPAQPAGQAWLTTALPGRLLRDAGAAFPGLQRVRHLVEPDAGRGQQGQPVVDQIGALSHEAGAIALGRGQGDLYGLLGHLLGRQGRVGEQLRRPGQGGIAAAAGFDHRREPTNHLVEIAHGAGAQTGRTGRPAAAIAALVSPMVRSPKWKIEAASTASA